LLLQKHQHDLAEENFRKALAVANGQKAKLWGLRAAMSLCRLADGKDLDRDRTSGARETLAAIYRSFSEGFSAQDLATAKALIDRSSEATL
jgi:predicted ATPase